MSAEAAIWIGIVGIGINFIAVVIAALGLIAVVIGGVWRLSTQNSRNHSENQGRFVRLETMIEPVYEDWANGKSPKRRTNGLHV